MNNPERESVVFHRMFCLPALLALVFLLGPSMNLFSAEGDILGNQIKKRVPVSASAKRWALIKLPDDFDADPGKKYPLIVFCHGAGESNNDGSSEAAVSKLLSHGPPRFISLGNKMEFTNPRNGQLYKFIVVSPQADTAVSFTPAQIKYLFENEPLIKDRIDRRAVFLTGLSLGGRSSMLPFAVPYEGILHHFTALAPMSPFKSGDTYTWQKGRELKTPVWTFCGVSDSAKFTEATQELETALNAVNPGQVRATWYPAGHTGWNNYYNPGYRESFDGVRMNVYEWFLSKIDDGSEPLPTPAPGPSPTPPPAAGAPLVDFNSSLYATSNLPMNGFVNGAAEVAFSGTVRRNPVSPSYNYGNLPDGIFYGGAKTDAGPGLTGYRVQATSSSWLSNNWFWVQAGAAGSGVAGKTLSVLTLWKKENFLNGLHAVPVRLGGDSSLLVTSVRVGHSGPSNELRLVFQKGGAYFISGVIGTYEGTKHKAIDLTGTSGLSWFRYDPEAGVDAIGEAASLSDFANIEAVGILSVSKALGSAPPRMEVGRVTIYGSPSEESGGGGAPVLEGVVSRKTHGPAGSRDLELALDGSGVEPRKSENCTLIFTFDKDVLDGLIAIEEGTASLASPPSCSGKTMTVNLDGVEDAQNVILKLVNVLSEDSGTYTGEFSFRVLAGDADGNGTVNAEDRIRVQQNLGKTAASGAVREDLNLNGGVSVADVMVVQQRLGHSVP